MAVINSNGKFIYQVTNKCVVSPRVNIAFGKVVFVYWLLCKVSMKPNDKHSEIVVQQTDSYVQTITSKTKLTYEIIKRKVIEDSL